MMSNDCHKHMTVHLTEFSPCLKRRFTLCGDYDVDADKRYDTVFDVLKSPAEQAALEFQKKAEQIALGQKKTSGVQKTGGKNTIVVSNILGCHDFSALVSEALSYGFVITMIRFLPRKGKSRSNAYVVFGSNAECAAFMDMVAACGDSLDGVFKAQHITYSEKQGKRHIQKKFGGLKCAETNTWKAPKA
jgi:hypothetical protein